MSTAILATKLYIPPPRPGMVQRRRLIDRLNEGLATGRTSGVTLISASAGFGKTTLVSDWITGCGRPVAWLSLDEADSDPVRFITYLVAALQTIQPGIGQGALATLQSPPPLQMETIFSSLLNDMCAVPAPFLLVLDDYHAVDSIAVDQILTFLVEHQPPQLHLVIATREDPALPLARLRVRGQLTELRAADLRFTPDEAAAFLNQAMHLNLSTQDIATLENRTEGWIAGLQLAALSMQGRHDTAHFIQSFTGSHRFVLDYLVEEVLQRQPERVRSFLLQTSLLDRLTGSLCNTLTGQDDGKTMLETLERSNLFVIPLDDRHEWFRYHHLFAEVLRSYLQDAQPEHVVTLHSRACDWYEQHGLPAEAIRHSLAARDFQRSADLIERVWLEMDLSYQSAAWLVWAKALPEEIILARPVLCVGFAWALLAIGEIEASETRLRHAERWLDPAGKPAEISSAGIVVVDKAEYRALPASIAAARAYRALALEDIPATKRYANQALALVTEDENVHRTQATALLAMAEYADGNLPAAEQQFLKFQAMMWQVNNIASAIGITYILANIMLVQGRLQEAVSAYRQAIQLAENRGASFFVGSSDLHRGLSELLCELGDLETATRHLLIAQQMGERGALTGWPHRLCVAQARLAESRGDLAGALVLLDEAERQYVRNPLPDRSIAALKARTWLRQERVVEALAWSRDQRLSPDDDLSYLREFEYLILARLLIAQFKANRSEDDLQAALELLARLLKAAEDGGRMGSTIEILILQALAHQAQGNLPLALAGLERALSLAEPQGYVRCFIDEGEPMRGLVEKAARSRDTRLNSYANRLLAFFTHPDGMPISASSQNRIATIEPLSERELDVLRLLQSELTGPEIAQQLVVSLNTLRTHTKNIFSKLGVDNRRAAVRRAKELDLI